MWIQCFYKKVIPIDSDMIREKAKSFHDNLQQKESEGPKAGEVQGSK